MDVSEAVAAMVKQHKPALAFAARRPRPDENVNGSSVFASVELEGATLDEVAAMLAAIQTVYSKLVRQLSESAKIPERDFHARVARYMSEGRLG